MFADPPSTWRFLKLLDRIRASKFNIDQLDYILMGDPAARAAAAEKTIAPVLTTLQKSLQALAAAADPANIPATVAGLGSAIAAQLQTLGWDAASVASLLNVFNNQIQLPARISGGTGRVYLRGHRKHYPGGLRL